MTDSSDLLNSPQSREERGALFSGISLFAGCGGSDLGMREGGIESIWANDISQDACSLYARVTGSPVIEHGNIRSVDEFPKADVLCGCYPCQGYSQGGTRVSSDRRNLLYREFDRVLRKTRPLAFIVENVDGIRFTHNAALLRSQLVRFRLAGYSVSRKVLNAKDFGLAQDRKRLFIVGVRSGEPIKYQFPQPTHGSDTGLKPYRTQKDVIWSERFAPEGSYNAEPFHWYYLSRNRWRAWSEQSRCVVAHWRHVQLHPDSPPLRRVSTDRWEFTDEGPARRLSYIECALLQGFIEPAAFHDASISVRSRFRAVGNAVPPPLFGAVARSLVRQLSEGRAKWL